MRQVIVTLLLCTGLLAASAASAAAREAVVLTVDGAIGPATADYLVRGIEAAHEGESTLIVIRMDTPGGLDGAMRDIIQAILASPVPVATWVSPRGARAASAGTYILYASHIAAMAPATNLGAATPVTLGPGENSPGGKEKDKANDNAGNEDAKGAMERKMVNDAVAYIRGLAEMRGRNADWAELAVREAASLSAEAALEQHVIDFVAADLPELFAAIDGREVETSAGTTVLETEGIAVERIEPDWRTEFLGIITNPTVAYLLMLIGIYGLLFEGYNPGAVVPGVAGAICLLLALYAFQVLPVNYAGLALIALGVILMAAEAFAPSFGSLGIGGVVAFIVGSVILMDTDIPGFGVPLAVILAISAVGAAIVLAIVWFAVTSKRTRVITGREEMVGLTGTVLKDFKGRGAVFVRGERWFAHSDVPLEKGRDVRVTRIKGLVLYVEPLETTSGTEAKEQAS